MLTYLSASNKLPLLREASNQVISEVVSDGGGRFSSAGIVGVHTSFLLLSSQAAHGRAAGQFPYTRQETDTYELTRGYSNPRQGGLTPSPCE